MYVELLLIALAAALSPIIISAFTRVVFSEQRAVAVPAFVGIVGALSFLVPLIVGRTFGAATGHADGDDTTKLLDVLAATALAVLLFALAAKNLRKRGKAAEGAGATGGEAGAADGGAQAATRDSGVRAEAGDGGAQAAAGDGGVQAEAGDGGAHAVAGDGGAGGAQAEAGSSLGLRGALGLGLAVVALNPKSIALFLAAGDVIGTETEAFAEAALAAAVFALACIAPIAGVAVYQVVGGEPAAQRIAAAEAWMVRNGPMIKAVVLGLIGAFFAYKAITGIGKL
jgi:hypothetical protein